MCEFKLRPFLERIRKRIPFLWYLLRCFVDGVFAWFRPIRTPYRCWKLCSNVLYMIVLVGCLLVLILPEKFKNTENFPLLSKKFYRSENAQTPRYLLLGIDGLSEPRCKPIFESSVPYSLQQNITDKELINSLFGKKINLAYVIRSYPKERAPIMQGKLCLNSSNEWMLLTILGKGSQQRSISESLQAIEALLDESREAHQCISFDLEKCSLKNFGNDDYPKLFKLDQEQNVKVVSTSRIGSVYMETVHTVLYYIRHKAADIFRHRKRLTEIDSAPLNMTIVPDLITSHMIRITVKTTQSSALFTNMGCVASLQGNGSTKTCSFPVLNTTVEFNQLSPSTKYEICINCEEINKICAKIETYKKKSFDYRPYTKYSFSKDIRATILKYAIVVIIIVVFTLMIILLFKRTIVEAFFCRLFIKPNGPEPAEPEIIARGNDLLTPDDTASVTTMDGIINEERRSSFTSLNSSVINPP